MTSKTASERQELVKLILARKGIFLKPKESLQRRPPSNRAILSHAQERLWFIEQLQPGNVGYNMAGMMRVRGALGLGVLERVVNEVVGRHEVLRTTFEDGEKGLVQVILEARWQALPVVDLSGLEELERQKMARELTVEEGRRGFDLRAGPVVRVSVMRLAEQEHVILYTLHHIASDGWSMGVLNREIGLLYEAFRRGEPSPLEELPVQYADYAVWQRGWLEGEVLERQMKYWKEQLAGISALELPTDRVRPVVQNFKGGIKRLRIGREMAGALKQLSQREGVTLFMTLLGGLQVMLSRYSGQEDIAVGAPIANRNQVEIEGLIGFFVNTLVLRTDMSGEPTVSELLGRVREVTLGAYGHQDLPFEKLVEELQPERDLSRSPLVQVSLELQNAPDEGVELDGLKLEPMEGGEITTRWDLEWHFRETVEGLNGWMVYDRELFEEGSMERMGMHLERVLEGMGALGGGVRVSGLKLMEPSEEAEMVEGWNRTEMEYEREKCAHELFEEQARARCEAVAVECGQEAVSFGELNERAQRVAWRLRQLGVGPEVLVGVCLERSVEMVVGLLGVWKAGGAYVPLDPANPMERLASMMEDAGITVLVTSRALEEKLPMNGSIVVYVEEAVGGEGLEEAELWGWSSGVGAWNLAYVMYTSGSTGRPKGVMVAHRGLVNYLSWSVRAYGMEGGGQGLGSAVHSSIGFDLTVTSLYTPLVGGRRVRMIREQEGVGGVEEVMKGKGYGLLKVTPGHLEVMRGLGKELGGLAGAMVIGGEALKGTAIREWQRQAEGTRLINEYGPTETVVGCCVYEVKGSQEIVGAVPIGRPIGNTRIYVMGRQYEVQAVGMAGEIWIGGDGVARGYWNRSELTAEKFVPDPYGKCGGERMYRSGDVGRYMADGTLEYMGRQDQQVKVRGYRIELGEIEKVLSGHAEVRQSVVVVREDGNGERKLVGYVVGRGAEEGESQREQVGEWKEVFNEHLYDGAGGGGTRNFTGWNSSYTGQPIEAEEMNEWLEGTASAIRALKPGRVLEIGSGSGLVLFEVAPWCTEYWGTDFSGRSLEYVRRQLSRQGLGNGRVKLLEREADNFEGMEGEGFDGVVINSVAQYFPDMEYLVRVLDGAVGVVKEGGFIYVGDVRSKELWGVFHGTVEVARAGEGVSVKQLRQRIEAGQRQEKELLVEAGFFEAYGAQQERIKGVRIRPKRGKYRNELSMFRYEVMLTVGGRPEGLGPQGVKKWAGGQRAEEAVREMAERGWESFVIEEVGNGRLDQALELERLIWEGSEERQVGGIRRQAQEVKEEGMDPEEWYEAGERMGYEVELSWARGGRQGGYDVEMWKGQRPARQRGEVELRPWREYGTEPLRGRAWRRLGGELKRHAAERLPQYMVPAVIVVLEEMPLTGNGKVDRRKLPEPVMDRVASGRVVEARTEVERRLERIWSEVLGVGRVSMEDNFFELGGHSLLATQVASRIRESFQVELPLRLLFENPTIASLSKKIEELQQQGTDSQIPHLMAVARNGRLPLSHAQERLWFIEQLQPGNVGYNMTGMMRVRGALGLGVLERVMNEVVRRHEVLRTTFEDGEKGLVQVILEARWQALPVVDLSGLEELERQKMARELTVEEGRRGFDLRAGPVVRVSVMRLAEQEHVILYTLHHIASDGWSMGVLNREIGLLYEAFRRGEPSPLEELPVQYADYAVWQRGWLEGEVLERQMKYWKEQLTGINPLELPTDHVRPVVQNFKGGVKRLRIGRGMAGALKQLSQREGVTLFMTLLGGLQVMLSRYSGQEDIAVGAPIANRNQVEIEGLIGFFVNTLVLRTDLSGEPTVSELLGRVREVTLGAYGHQDLPFEKLVEELQPERDLSRSPLVQVSLELQNAPDEGVELDGLKLEPMEGGEITTRWDLEWHFRETVEGLSGWMVYDRELFEEGSMERMGMHLERVLEGMGALGGGVRISGLKLMESSEEAEMVERWNRTEMEYEREKCAHELFEEQVRTRGEAVAVECGQEAVSFGELNERAQRVAWRLRQLGVGPEVLVGVCLERSVEMVAGLLGVWKAGGAYVPLDPANPMERLAYMMEDAGITVLVTSRALEEKLPMNGSIVVYVEEAVGGEGLEEAELWGWSSGVGAWNLAYVMYTSGSTGRPKGVMVAHRGLVNYLSWSVRAYGMEGGGQGLGSAVHSSIGFDLTVTSLYTPLVGGRRVRMIREQEGVGGVEEVMKGKGYGLLKVTPGHLEVMRGLGKELGGLAGAMVIGGEALKGTAIREWQRQAEGTRLINEYGPTETVVGCCVYEVKGSQEIVGAVPIGRPIGNTRIYVMGRQYEVQAVGMAGEIWIGGDGVARGYWNRSELTAEKFVPDPYGKCGGERMYRSGDVGRYMADGTLEYMGRQDQQVKVRGYRIELGEIEKVLSGHAEVRQSVVVVREDGNGERKLVGYVVGRGAEEGESQREQVGEWKEVFNEHLYEGAGEGGTRNFTGWNSSYTGQPIEAEEMNEWLEGTVSAIRALKPGRILEIGSGSGLVLFEVAPWCTEYWGTDFSGRSLEYVRRQLSRQGLGNGRVKLLEREADNFEGMEGEGFDGVVINSVAQYFPDMEYLVRVLDGAVGVVKEGGFIYVGDVRSKELWGVFHGTVEVARAGEGVSVKQLRQRIEAGQRQEKELLVEAGFFEAYGAQQERIKGVRIRPKRGKYRNELSMFRYEVMLTVGGRPEGLGPQGVKKWAGGQRAEEAVREMAERGWESFVIEEVGNGRLDQALELERLIWEGSEERQVGGIRRQAQEVKEEGMDPEEWYEAGERMGYEVELSWARGGRQGGYDVEMWKGQRPARQRGEVELRPWREYGTEPLRGRAWRRLGGELKRHAAERLPQYMVPAVIVVLEEMPLTGNGKVDRRKLPEPVMDRVASGRVVEARTEVERRLERIWSEVLGVGRVSMEDNFFELGGHSLLATQVASRIRESFQVELPLRLLFENPTIASLGNLVTWALKDRQACDLEDVEMEEGAII